jgi:hypothetical protein
MRGRDFHNRANDRVDPNSFAMHLDDALGDRQSPVGAALLAGDRIVGLTKLRTVLWRALIGRIIAYPAAEERWLQLPQDHLDVCRQDAIAAPARRQMR